MNARQFFNLTARMRKEQKAYFKTRSRDALNRSKELERLVDAEIDRVNKILNIQETKQQTLWEQ